jgi:hypothetical protein
LLSIGGANSGLVWLAAIGGALCVGFLVGFIRMLLIG